MPARPFWKRPVWRRIGQFVQLLGPVLAVAGVILAGIEYFLHRPIFYNPSKDLVQRYNADVSPLVESIDQSTPEIIKAIKANDNNAFQKATIDFVDKNKLRGKIIIAVETIEHIIDCHQSYICLFEGYSNYEQPIRRFWYGYRPAVETMRGNIIPSQFGSKLENEARRILIADRERGYLPKP